jgi:hypothetical protein
VLDVIVLAPLTLAVVLTVGGVAKLRTGGNGTDDLLELGVPSWLATRPLARVHPWTELLLALGLVASTGILALVLAWLAALLMAAYLVLVARAARSITPKTCTCFGEPAVITGRTVVRNAALTGLGVVAIWAATRGGGPTLLAEGGTQEWAWIGGAAAVALVVHLTWGGAGDAATAEHAVPPETQNYEGQPIPLVCISDAAGMPITLRTLCRTRAALVVFVRPTCGSCRLVLSRLPGYAASLPHLAFHAVTDVDIHQLGPEMSHLAATLLYDTRGEYQAAFTIPTPSAILLGVDGLIARGPIVGSDDIATFVDALRHAPDATPTS